jgi:hypothetical protein
MAKNFDNMMKEKNKRHQLNNLTDDNKDLIDVLIHLYMILVYKEIDDDRNYHEIFVNLLFHQFELDDLTK